MSNMAEDSGKLTCKSPWVAIDGSTGAVLQDASKVLAVSCAACHFGSDSLCQQALSSGWTRNHRGAHLSGTHLIMVLSISCKCLQRCVLP